MGSWYWRRKACQRDSAFASVNLFGPKRSRRSAASALVRPRSGSTPSSRTAPSSESTCQTGASVVAVEGVVSVMAIRSPLGPSARAAARADAGPGSDEPASPEQVIGFGRQLPAGCALRSGGGPLEIGDVRLDRRGVGLELLALKPLRALHRPLDLRPHVRDGDDDEAGRALVELLAELLEVVAAHAGRGVAGDGAEDGATGRRAREQAAADGGEGEERDDQPGRQPHPAAQHPADPRWRLVLLDDPRLALVGALDGGGVVGVNQPRLGVQVADQLVVGLRGGDVVVDAHHHQQRVDRHGTHLGRVRVGARACGSPRGGTSLAGADRRLARGERSSPRRVTARVRRGAARDRRQVGSTPVSASAGPRADGRWPAGRLRHAMSVPSAATSATRIDARDMAWTKASRAGAPTAALIWPAPPSDSRAAAATGRGTPAASPSARRLAYSEDMRLPTMAIPSAPPSSRVVSLTAEPMFPRSGGSDAVIDSVAGVPARPMPAPMRTRAIARRL